MIIKELLDNMPLVLEFFLPGYLGAFFYRRFKSNNSSMLTEKIHIGTAVCISYLLRSTLRGLYYQIINCFGFAFLARLNTSSWRIFITSAICISGAAVLAKIRRIHEVRQCFSKIAKSSLSENVFEGCDLEDNQEITVYLNERIIKGRLILYGQEQNDQWLAIDKCIIKDRDGRVVDHWMYHGYERYLIPIKEVKGIVVHYPQTTKFLPPHFIERRVEEQKKARKFDTEHPKK